MEVRLAAETAALHSASECWSVEQLSQLLRPIPSLNASPKDIGRLLSKSLRHAGAILVMRPAWELGLMEGRLAAETAALHSGSSASEPFSFHNLTETHCHAACNNYHHDL